MKNLVYGMYFKALYAKEKAKKVLLNNSGQGAVDTAVICEPFLR